MRIFVTGASGFIGSAIVTELRGAGHHVTGLARSDASAATLKELGADVHPGSLEDVDSLRAGAAASDGVVHMGFIHDFSRFHDSVETDRRAIEALGSGLAGTVGRPLVIASGILGVSPGKLATERTAPSLDSYTSPRLKSAELALSFSDKGVRPVVLRLPPTVHGKGDHGFVPALIGISRDKRLAGYIGDGSNRWPAVHRLDAARLCRIVVENPKARGFVHPIHDEGVPARQIAEVIGRHLGVPVASIAKEQAAAHFGWIAPMFALDAPASSAITRDTLGWNPAQPGLLDDLEAGHYFTAP